MRATATGTRSKLPTTSGRCPDYQGLGGWNDIVFALVEDTVDDIISGYHMALLRPFTDAGWWLSLLARLQ